MSTTRKISGIQKVAVILSTLDADTAATLIREFSDEEIAAISGEMSNFERIDKELVETVLNDLAHELKLSKTFLKYDNNQFKKILVQAVGSQKSEDILSSVEEGTLFPVPFYLLRDASEEELLRILVGEHPQTIALILTYCDPQRSAKVLSKFPSETQADIIMRIATMEAPPVKLLYQVNEVVMSKVKTDDKRQKTPTKKKFKLASNIISGMERPADKNVVELISHKNPELADEIKKLLFTFEDVVYVQDDAFRKVLTEVDNGIIALALKTATEEVAQKFFSNMSKRVGDSVREEQELLGPRLLSEVEASQQQIIDAIKRIEEKGELIMKRKGGEGSVEKFV